jgi:hypothetical protein
MNPSRGYVNSVLLMVRAYQTATGRIVGAILMDVLEPLYIRHPELKPTNWDA